jgi:hypothetical protein
MIANVKFTRLIKNLGVYFCIILFLSCGGNTQSEDSDDLSQNVKHKILDVEDAKSQLNLINSDLVKQYNGRRSATIETKELEMLYASLAMAVQIYNSTNNKDLNFDNLRFYIIPTKNESGQVIADITARCFESGDDWLEFSDHYLVKGKSSCNFKISIPVKLSGVITKFPVLTLIEM